MNIEFISGRNTGSFRYAILDFDGTLSLIREGWQQIMVPYFTDELCSTPEGSCQLREDLELHVREFVTLLTGKQTIGGKTYIFAILKTLGLLDAPAGDHH